jgi:imidazolonepropionase-like amidohydrolase
VRTTLRRISLVGGLSVLVGCATDQVRAREISAPPGQEIAPRSASAVREAPAAVMPLQPEGGLVLRGVRLIDGTGSPVRERVDVLVRGDEVVSVGEVLAIPSGAGVLELEGKTLLPGLIDAHVHLTSSPAGSYEHGVVRTVSESEADRALRGAANARLTLEAGFTTVRNLGGSLADRALRDAIAQGQVVGPRMLVANHSIGITGGHCDRTNHMHPDTRPHEQSFRTGLADGVDEVRKAVRYQIKHGADVIKICASGGVMSQGDAVGASQLTLDEMKAAVDEAVRADRKVAAHAHGTAAILDAVQAGVHSIEHGSVLDAAAAGLMKRRGTVLVPTLYVGSYVLEQADAGAISAHSAAKAREIVPRMRLSFELAVREGIPIVLGSDAGVFPHGANGRELVTMVELGMSPMAAIVAATSAAADLLGLDDVGHVAEGKLADLVVVDGDPLVDIELLLTPIVVIKGGVVHRGQQRVSSSAPFGSAVDDT